eukprot:2225306-Rhodomonas_salina.1
METAMLCFCDLNWAEGARVFDRNGMLDRNAVALCSIQANTRKASAVEVQLRRGSATSLEKAIPRPACSPLMSETSRRMSCTVRIVTPD